MMKISSTVQNQTAIYIFSLMMFCESTHKPLWYCPPPAAPTLGTEQLTSSGNVSQKGLIDTSCSTVVILSTVWFLFIFCLIRVQILTYDFEFRISANSFRGNNSFWKVENVEIFIRNFSFWLKSTKKVPNHSPEHIVFRLRVILPFLCFLLFFFIWAEIKMFLTLSAR